MSKSISIYRDQYGVPSIDAPSAAAAAFGLGWAMAQDCAPRMAQLYLSAKGRSAEVVGDIALQMDFLVRALDIEAAARREAVDMDDDLRDILQGFCDGVNRLIDIARAQLPAWVTPIEIADILGLVHLSNIAFPLLELTQQLTPGSGSNQFALAPRHTANGHAIVSIDPHLDWDKAISWYEFSQYTPELASRGIAVCGMPIAIMGHNERLGWSITNNSPMLHGLFTLDIDPADPSRYSYHGEWRKFEDSMCELRCINAAGETRVERMPLRQTAWGPVISVGGKQVALHMPLVDARTTLNQARAMMAASTVDEFRESLRPLGLSMWNLVFADVDGGLGYQYNARVYRRDEKIEWSMPVPGGDPATRWGDPIPLDELPHVMRPAAGVLINANSSPWLTSPSAEIPSERWPEYVTSHPSTFRYQRLADLLDNPRDITIQRAMEIAVDTMTPAGVQVRDLLVDAAKDSADLAEAVSVLKAWDGRADHESRGTAIYHYWLAIFGTHALAEKLVDGEAWTSSDTIVALGALREAVAVIRLVHGSVDIPWGHIHVSQRNGLEAPVTGFYQAVAPNHGPTVDGKVVCEFGSSFRMIIELDPAGIKSWSAKPFGNALMPSSPHFTDQMAMFGRGEYKDTYFGLQRIQKAAVSTELVERD